jgi:hypothetical protein
MPRNYVNDPDIVAYYEKEGWAAYYDRAWTRALRLLYRMNRDAFRMSRMTALSASLDTVRASVAFAPLATNDVPKAQRHMARFYEKARRNLDITADAETLATLEMEYWVVHRELAIRRRLDQTDDDVEPMVRSLMALHAALFNSTPEVMRPSAEWRAEAAKAVDRITGKYSEDVAEDWRRVEEYLRNAYRAVKAAILSPSAAYSD